MGYRVWYSTESLADYIIDNTNLLHETNIEKKKMYESDANNSTSFHALPDHIKKILYLDAPDLIVEKDLEPIFSIEISTEAGTGHNVFQRFPRLVASMENNVPSFYIYPDAAIIHREANEERNIPATTRWDKLNPSIFKALKNAMDIHAIPALFYYFPTDLNEYTENPEDSPHLEDKGLHYDLDIVSYPGCPDATHLEMIKMFSSMNAILNEVDNCGVIDGRNRSIRCQEIVERIDLMASIYHTRAGTRTWSPLTSIIEVPTEKVLKYLSDFHSANYNVGDLLNSRETTVIYKVNADFRGDPYPGALAAIDYLKTRQGRSFEERYYNLVLAWGQIRETNDSIEILPGNNQGIDAFCTQVASSEQRSNILHKSYDELNDYEISSYYMQVRYGSMFSKVKHIRVYSYFADAILFYDGALWRDG